MTTLLAPLLLSVAAALPGADKTGTFPGAQDGFMYRLQSLCDGRAYAGRLVSTDEADAEMAAQPMVMHASECVIRNGKLTQIKIPFQVGEDRSRTWVVTRLGSGVRLKHRHRHEDGTDDALTMYGGHSAGDGTFTRQDFPADEESKEMFEAGGIPQSSANVWAVEMAPGDRFAYEMTRPGRMFRVEFDLSRSVEYPGPAWGEADRGEVSEDPPARGWSRY